jgi:hypothetical protein
MQDDDAYDMVHGNWDALRGRYSESQLEAWRKRIGAPPPRPAAPESETPEVDAAQFFAGNIHKSEFSTGEMVVKVDLARSLERRLSLAQTEIKGHMRVAKEVGNDALDMAANELERAFAEADTLNLLHGAARVRALKNVTFESPSKLRIAELETAYRAHMEALEKAQARIAELEKALKAVKTQIVNLPRSSTADTIHSAVEDVLKDRA